jgi:hypothetical protein
MSNKIAIVIATESHREALLSRLWECGVDTSDAIESGRYLALDAAATLSTFMVNGSPDPSRFISGFHKIMTSVTPGMGVVLFGEGVQLLWEQGNLDAAIEVERLCSRLTSHYDLEMLCGYSVSRTLGGMEDGTYKQICAEHSSAYRC